MGSLRGRGQRGGFKFVEFLSRRKLSASGVPAEEFLSFDRTAAEVTVKRHRVDEQQPDGSWKVEHDEVKVFPAKRRPR
jgi:hypothetical protein